MRLLLFLIAAMAVHFLRWILIPAETSHRYKTIELPEDVIVARSCWFLAIVMGIVTSNQSYPHFVAVGLGLYLIGQFFIVLAVRDNPYFSPEIIAPPVVVNSGIYRHFQHPAYAGHLLSILAVGLIWPTLWSLPFAFIFIVILCCRAIKENRLLAS